jgi:uncharacterized protein YbbK (DUF523 family)
METIIVSACLLGDKCRYDGKGNYNDNIKFLREHFDIVPICPEQFGGMTTPRDPSEVRGDTVVSNKGKDVTKYFEKGRDDVLNIVKYFHIRKAVLADKSPSCGVKQIYNGRFNGNLIDGQGITTRALTALGVQCVTIDEVEQLIDKTQKQIFEEKEKAIQEREAIRKEKEEKNAEYSRIANKKIYEERKSQNRFDHNSYHKSYNKGSYTKDDSRTGYSNRRSYGNKPSYGEHSSYSHDRNEHSSYNSRPRYNSNYNRNYSGHSSYDKPRYNHNNNEKSEYQIYTESMNKKEEK